MRFWLGTAFAALCISAAAPVLADDFAAPPGGEDLSNLSIEQLANIKVRSVSKREEPLSAAPASLYVIDHEQIVRSGAITIPEILRLAPNLQVYQQTPAHWVVTARGLNGNGAAQSFSNKLLVLVDGRTVYAPHFSGVYWDLPDVLPEDIERIEVISGPGATLWGANAVNGVINIITRSASSTSGAFVDAQGGAVEQVAGVRLAGALTKNLDYRVYGRWLHQDAAQLPSGGGSGDGWYRLGGGFRFDLAASARDTVTFQGDIFDGREDEPAGTREIISGRNLVLRWDRDDGQGHGLRIQTFYDRIHRGQATNSPWFTIDTYDADFQHSLGLGARQELVWGGGARIAHYDIGTTPFSFQPPSRSLFIGNLFIQDSFSLKPVTITAGLKAEHDPYVGFSLLPSVRVAVTPSEKLLLWGAISRAVRSPTPFDEDVRERVGTIIALNGNPDFRTEKLTAYELGLRAQPLSKLSFSITGFYHHYDDLRSVEVGSGPATLLNLHWGNNLAGHTYGVEAWASANPLPWWTLSAGTTLLQEQFHFKPTATATFIGTSQNGVDPGHTITLRSSMDLGSDVDFDVDFRSVGRLRNGGVPAYSELGGRLAWNVSNHLTLSLSGANLLHARHVEYPGGDAISRKVLAGLQWRP